MKYTIAEVLEDGRSYVVIVMDDGSSFGQIIDLRECADISDADKEVAKCADKMAAERLPRSTFDVSPFLRVERTPVRSVEVTEEPLV